MNDFILVQHYDGHFIIIQEMPSQWNPLKQEYLRLLWECQAEGTSPDMTEINEAVLQQECTKWGLYVSFVDI